MLWPEADKNQVLTDKLMEHMDGISTNEPEVHDTEVSKSTIFRSLGLKVKKLMNGNGNSLPNSGIDPAPMFFPEEMEKK